MACAQGVEALNYLAQKPPRPGQSAGKTTPILKAPSQGTLGVRPSSAGRPVKKVNRINRVGPADDLPVMDACNFAPLCIDSGATQSCISLGKIPVGFSMVSEPETLEDLLGN